MDLEELIYEYGHVMYMIGRYETDGKETQKEYNKLIKRKEEIKDLFNQNFKGSKAVAKSLNLI